MSSAPQLTVTTPSDREIQMTRVFDAPPSAVFAAMSQAELLLRWLSGPPGWTMTECESDLKVDGKFRHVWRGPDNIEMAMHGIYREITPPTRLVRTERFEFGCEPQAGEQLATMALKPQGTQTLLTVTILYPSKEARDATIASGMEHGVSAGYQRLDELLASA